MCKSGIWQGRTSTSARCSCWYTGRKVLS